MRKFLYFGCLFIVLNFVQLGYANVLQKIFAEQEFEKLSNICKKINSEPINNCDTTKLDHFLWHNDRDFLDCCQIYNFCKYLASIDISSDTEKQCLTCLKYVLAYLTTKKQAILHVYKHRITKKDSEFLKKLDEMGLLSKIREIEAQNENSCNIS